MTLSDEERAALNCDCAKPYNWTDHVMSCRVPVVESIVADRERSAARRALIEAADEYDLHNPPWSIAAWLRARAAELTAGSGT